MIYNRPSQALCQLLGTICWAALSASVQRTCTCKFIAIAWLQDAPRRSYGGVISSAKACSITWISSIGAIDRGHRQLTTRLLSLRIQVPSALHNLRALGSCSARRRQVRDRSMQHTVRRNNTTVETHGTSSSNIYLLESNVTRHWRHASSGTAFPGRTAFGTGVLLISRLA